MGGGFQFSTSGENLEGSTGFGGGGGGGGFVLPSGVSLL